MLQACVGLNQELNFDYIQELKIMKMHQATCEENALTDSDEKKLKLRRKELKVAKRKQKEEYKNLKDIEDVGIQELIGLSSSIEKIEAEIQVALERERELKERRGEEGESGWQVPIGDPRYGNLKSSARSTKEDCHKVIAAQEQVINSLMERLEKERERHGPCFEKKIEEFRLEVIALSSQLRMDLRSAEDDNTPGGGKSVDIPDVVNEKPAQGVDSSTTWKQFHGVELLDDGLAKVKVNDSFVTVARDEAGVVRVRSLDGSLIKQLACTDEAWKLGATFANLVSDLRSTQSNAS